MSCLRNPKHRKFEELVRETDKSSVMNTVEYLRMEGREEGIELGIEQAATTFVKNLLNESEFTDEKIASLANVTVEFVNEVKDDLKEAE